MHNAHRVSCSRGLGLTEFMNNLLSFGRAQKFMRLYKLVKNNKTKISTSMSLPLHPLSPPCHSLSLSLSLPLSFSHSGGRQAIQQIPPAAKHDGTSCYDTRWQHRHLCSAMPHACDASVYIFTA